MELGKEERENGCLLSTFYARHLQFMIACNFHVSLTKEIIFPFFILFFLLLFMRKARL